ncbi:MAG TPA: GWxTD domain-containing protein [Candidatus Krumholzibacteria bacterium]|nr:GWxTD domain-containing protein [Candidatus Krumholzibacteria bacterium]
MALVRAVLGVTLLALATTAHALSPAEKLRRNLAKQQLLQSSESVERWLGRVVEADPRYDREGGTEPGTQLRLAYHGLQYLLTDALREQFLGLSSDSLREEWVRRYWVLRDPTPTTPENERREEHEQRVLFAREHFATASPPYWDDRGAFLILYGPPDGMSQMPADVSYALGLQFETLYWFYGKSDLVVQFEQRPPGGPWVFGRSSASFTSRPEVQAAARRGASDFFRGFGLSSTHYNEDIPTFADADPFNAAAVAVNLAGARDVLENHHERFFFPGMPVQFLWFVFDADTFLPESGNSALTDAATPGAPLRLEAHVQFVLRDLTYQWQDSLYAARYRLEGTLFDAELREAARDAYETDLTAWRFDTTERSSLYPGQLNFGAPPGRYLLALRLLDLRSGDQGSYTTEVVIPDLRRTRLALSDIELATSIAPAGAYRLSRFAKRDRLVLPNPIGAYGLDKQVTAYFEIYGLQLDEQRRGRYRISYRILPVSSSRNEPRPVVTSSFLSESQTTDCAEELRIDVGELGEAAYELVIEIQDLVGGAHAETRTPFSALRF